MNERWRKLSERQISEAEHLLQSRERWCMNACSRFLNRDSQKTHIWALSGRNGEISALLVHYGQTLLPVFSGRREVPPPHFLCGPLGTAPIHSLQGTKDDTVIMETAMEKIGLNAAQIIDYDVMCIDRAPSDYQSAGPADLIIRKAQAADMDALTELHAAYEQEEVLPAASKFNAAVSRLNTQRIFTQEQMLVAELGGYLIGKINTNAAAFTRFQVGGVYVHPDYRRLGIGRRMAGEFAVNLVAQGRGISLFVKKSNPCARRLYQRIGFAISGDYRICYY